MINSYTAWGSKLKYADVYNTMYGDIIDFTNFRIETANTCLGLIEEQHIGDALGLCRSLLENYLLLILICRGTKMFQLQDLSSKSAEEFAKILAKNTEAWKEEVAAGKTNCIDLRKYPRAKRHIMYVYEGLNDTSIKDLKIPMHYFLFKEFSPETMRLDTDDYFEYYEKSPSLRKALKGHRSAAKYQYQHYLSYDALLECLRLNEITDDRAQHRIEAHYTFLGRYLHPTHSSYRELRERDNVHSGQPAIGMDSPYTKSAHLLAAVYVLYLIAGLLEEMSVLVEQSPGEYVSEPGTSEMRNLFEQVPETTPYFWFIFNDAPLYDRFNWAVNHATDKLLSESGGYKGLDSALIPFNQHIYGSLQSGLTGWSNRRVGSYKSPIT